jgi:hypothetical protein
MKLRKFFSKIGEGEDASCVVFGRKYLPGRLLRLSFYPFQNVGIVLEIERVKPWLDTYNLKPERTCVRFIFIF